MHLRFVAPCAALIVGLALPALAQEASEDGPFTRLEALISQPMDSDTWVTSLEGDSFTMENTTDDSGAYAWYLSPSNNKSHGLRTATASVEIADGDEYSHAGIVFGFLEEPNRFYLFALETNHYATLWHFTADGVTALTIHQSDTVIDGINELTVTEDGNQISLLVNDELVGMLGGLEGMGEGSFGIAAWGPGRFVFHGYDETAATPALSQ